MHLRLFNRQITSTFIFTMLTIFIIVVSSNTPVVAWNNGSYAYDPQDYDYETDYGTHDWIADAALNYLIDHNASQWNWLDSRREIFYVGTEAPDNSGIDIILDGINVTGFGDKSLHHIYFYENGTVFANEDDSAIRAKWCGDWANVHIGDEKWDLAAYYLGAMTHYIADVTMFAHVAPNNVAPHFLYFDEHHSTVEGYVNTRTDKVNDPEEFIRFNLNSSISPISPYDVAITCAWDTYMDPTPSGSVARGSVWMHENFFTGWALTTEARDSETNTTMTDYYDRIEENLHMAIESNIGAMRYVVGEMPAADDEPTDDEPTDDELTDDDTGSGSGFISFPSGFTIVLVGSLGIVYLVHRRKSKIIRR